MRETVRIDHLIIWLPRKLVLMIDKLEKFNRILTSFSVEAVAAFIRADVWKKAMLTMLNKYN